MQALRLGDPTQAGYVVRWPIHGTGFNTRDYSSTQAILNDLETIIRVTLQDRFSITTQDFKVRHPWVRRTSIDPKTSDIFSCTRNTRFLRAGLRPRMGQPHSGVYGFQTSLCPAGLSNLSHNGGTFNVAAGITGCNVWSGNLQRLCC